MSLSSNIFQKPCPACASSVSVSAARCDCGHIFESAANRLSPLEATLRDEELYEGYLAARAEQARQTEHTAEQALAENAGNPELTSAAKLARDVARTIDGDLAEQRNKVAAIRKALREKEPAAPAPAAPAAVIEAAAVTKQAVTARPVVKPSIPVRPALAAAATPAAVASTNPPPVMAPAKPVSVPLWQATTAQKAASVLATLKNAKARESVARAQQAVAAAATAEEATAARAPISQSTPASTSSPSTVPPSTFRKEQASKAERIMEARKAVDGKECPNCTSSVPINTTRCRCGFAFVSGDTELPSLTLCTGDFTALRNSLKLNPRR